ncbi:MAG: DUF1080 domain-containing protein, partial [Phycisphaerae bacterium]|nr:DUF1080 domain-containing protein [Phycisphaerae bacterium]
MMKRAVSMAVGCGLFLVVGSGCASKWQPLFDGKTLDGWRATGNAVWTVEDGILVGKQDDQRRPGDLLTVDEFGDFELAVTFKAVWPANSGVWFRYADKPLGYQFDILEWPNPVCYSGTLYCPGKMFLAMNTDKSIVRYDDWNQATISAIGDHIVMTLNGHKVADLHDSTFQRGAIGFQIHAGDQFEKMRIMIKDIRIRVLDK